MNKFTILLLSGIISISFAFAQEADLKEFVEVQQEKLKFEESKLVHVPNTQVKIMPPPHFELDASIDGFVHAGSASTIQIIEVNGVSFKDIDKSMTPEHIKSQDYDLVNRKEVTLVSGDPGVIYFVEFIVDDVKFERAMLFTGNENTIWVNFNYPVKMKKLMYPAIESALLSVQPL